jgi:hypothetical protein
VRHSTRTIPACCGSLQKLCCSWLWREGGCCKSTNRCAGWTAVVLRRLCNRMLRYIHLVKRPVEATQIIIIIIMRQANRIKFVSWSIPGAWCDNAVRNINCVRYTLGHVRDPTEFNGHNPQFGSIFFSCYYPVICMRVPMMDQWRMPVSLVTKRIYWTKNFAFCLIHQRSSLAQLLSIMHQNPMNRQMCRPTTSVLCLVVNQHRRH